MDTLKGRLLRVSQQHGRFIITPLKKIYKEYQQSFPRLTYHAWASQNEERCFVDRNSSREPLISIIVPAYNTDENHLLAMVYSVVNQHYKNWELIIINASSEEVPKQKIDNCNQIDRRIKIHSRPNEGIAANTNAGIEHANGEYVAFLDHDDLLHPCALHSVVAAITNNQAELIYTDEDKIKDDSSMYFQPLFKPGWSPDLLRNVNYINHLTVVKADFVRDVGGLRKGFDGAQDYDFLLRVIDECKPKVAHIARVLYHWRAAATSTASDFSTKKYILEAGTTALQDHLQRNRLKGRPKAIAARPGFYEIEYDDPKAISIVVGPVQPDNQRLCAVWIEELSKYFPKQASLQIVIGAWFKPYKAPDSNYEVAFIPETNQNYWQEAAKLVEHEAVMVFQYGAMPANRDALARMCAASISLGSLVSPVIVSEKPIILDAGLVEAEYGLQPLFSNYEMGEDSYYGSTEWVRDVASLTMQVVAMPAKHFKGIAGSVDGNAFNSSALAKYKLNNHELRCISYAHEPLFYKGIFIAPELISDQRFNPQLTEAQSNMGVVVSAWGNLADISERENVG